MNLTKLGDYEIVRRIGQGGMGAVFEGVNSNIGRRVAIKVLLPEYAHQSDVVRRFWNEAKAVNAINHPGVVQVSEVGTAQDGSLYLVMEYLEGQTLSERLSASQGKLPQEEVITISWQLAGVLAAAHRKNIIHRDLKPANIMLVPDLAGPGGERIKLLDFGIAKLGIEHLHGEDVKTRTGQLLGTAAYMSPEQFMATQTVDGQTDVYSLGVVMYRLIAGQIPFSSANGQMALGMLHLTEPPPPLADRAKGTADWLVKLVHRMLAKAAADRPTMAQVMNELQEHLPLRQSSPALRPLLNPAQNSRTDVLPSPYSLQLADGTGLDDPQTQSVGAMQTRPASAPPDALTKHGRTEVISQTTGASDPSFDTALVSQKTKTEIETAPKPLLDTVSMRPSALESGSNLAEVSSLTGATGQSADRRSSGRVVTFVALGFGLLVIGGGVYLRTQSGPQPAIPAALPNSAPEKTLAAEPKASVDAGAPSEPAKETRAGATPSKTETAETAQPAAPGAAGRDSGTSRGKGNRSPASTKAAEKKNDAKPRRTSKPTPTPILD